MKQKRETQVCKKHVAKKAAAFTIALSILLSGTACGNNEDGNNTAADGDIAMAGDKAMAGDNTAAAENSAERESSQDKPDPYAASQASDDLKFLCSEDGNASCATQEGYYYISTESQKLQDGSLGYRLMYIDYASCQEICLCSAPGCSHDTKDCTAVLPYDEFHAHDSKLFLHQGSLYILNRQYDAEGSYSATLGAEGEVILGNVSSANPMPAALYRMNPDGTGRQKVFSFDPDLTLAGTLALDGQGLYAVSKKLSSEQTGTGEYTSSSEKTLVFLDLSSYSLSQIAPLEFGDSINWQLIGCVNGSFLLEGIDYGRRLTVEEQFGDDDDIYHELYKNSHTVFALLDPSSGSSREVYRMKNQETHSSALLNDTLYISFTDSKKILGVNVSTGEETLLSTHPQNYIVGTLGNMLCCQNLNTFTDPTYYFVDTDTGEIRHSDLVNKSLGWSLELVAETDSDVLVIYDYDAVSADGESYEIRLYQHGLISKEDLFSGKDNYRKIQMAGRGY